MKVLVVDDEEIKRVSLTDDLANAGFKTVSVSHGQEAIDLLDQDRLLLLNNLECLLFLNFLKKILVESLRIVYVYEYIPVRANPIPHATEII